MSRSGGDRLVYSSEQGRVCPACGKSESRCRCPGKAARARIQAREKADAARVLDSRALTVERLLEELEALLRDPSQLRRMGESASKLARPEASDRIIEECRSLLATESHEREG